MEPLYDRLKHLALSETELELLGFPERDLDYADEVRRKPPRSCSCHNASGHNESNPAQGERLVLSGQFETNYECARCKKLFPMGDDGVPLPSANICLFHDGFVVGKGAPGVANRYSCCGGTRASRGCNRSAHHVHRGDHLLANYTGYVETRPKEHLGRPDEQHGVFAIDCQTCYTTVGPELAAVTVVDQQLRVVYEQKVWPKHKVLDFNTKFTGLKAVGLDCLPNTLIGVQRDLLAMFSAESLLVGHSLDSDLKALKLIHKTCIDTKQLYPAQQSDAPAWMSLKMLMEQHLGLKYRDCDPCTGKEAAAAALRLALKKANLSCPTAS